MSISFKKRLKWYSGIFLIALIVLGVNIFQYDKVKDTYNTKRIFMCNAKYFYAMQRDVKPTIAEQLMQGLTPFERKPMTMADEYRQKKKRMLDGLEPRKHGKYDHIQPISTEPKETHRESLFKLPPNDPRNGLSKSQIAEAEKQYRACLISKQEGMKEAKDKKDRTETTMGVASVLMVVMLLLTLIDFVVLQFRKRKLKIQTGEITPMENKKITKIMILVFLVWSILSFVIAQSGYRHRFDTNAFLLMNIPTILIFGYLWVTDKFTLK